MNAHLALPVVAALTLTLGIALPLARAYVRDGTVALVRPRTALQRFLHTNFAGALVAYGAWTMALLALGPSALGVYDVPVAVQIVGLCISAVGLVLVMVAQAQMGRSWRIGIDTDPTALVTHGVFRWSRNPIYLGMVSVVLGIVFVAPSGWTLVGAVFVYMVTGFQARAEEQHLRSEHGHAFEAWAGRVGRLVPGIGRIRQGA